jgi:hypothetical protein
LAHSVAEEIKDFDDRVPDSGVAVIFDVGKRGLLAI